jgi:hypothetical protein
MNLMRVMILVIMKILKKTIIYSIAFFFLSNSAYAYFDPISVSAILQFFIFIFAFIISAISIFWEKTKKLFVDLFSFLKRKIGH